MDGHRILSLPGGDELGRAAPGALATFPADAMDRACGSPSSEGNAVRLQFEGSSTFEAWIEAIAKAERFVYFENYILRDDRVGRAFRDALMDKALSGVPVRLIHDWIGCWATPRRYWAPFRRAGVEVRAFNHPRIQDPFGVLQRDHRKLVCVDGEVAFVGGFCVGVEWAGFGDSPPWRDTGVEVRGPAAAVAGRAFERIWSEIGSPMPESLCCDPETIRRRGDTPVWIIEGEPGRSRLFRTLSLMAAHAKRRLWMTDPYFVAPRPVSEALAAAARDGVDVRILLPGRNNWPWVGSLSRGGYRFLMESGVRLFEWQGPMIHAKTSVCDGIWSRVGSSNLNSWSLLGNWEVDVGVLDESLAAQLEALFLADLASSVEIVLPSVYVRLRTAETARATLDPVELRHLALKGEPPKASLEPVGSLSQRLERQLKTSRGSTGWRMAVLARAGTVFGNALAGHRSLGREDRTVLGTAAVALLVAALVFALFPRIVGWTVAVILLWMGIVTGVRAFVQARQARREERGEREMKAELPPREAGEPAAGP
jgi:cardiolipin synthase